MGTTSNYSWPTPEATDLVKDGWEAIKDLGDAIDTTAAASFGGGLVHINTTTISASQATSVNDVFNATYENYLILVKATPSASSGNSLIRLRASGSDNANNEYRFYFGDPNSGSSTFTTGTGNPTTNFRVGTNRSGNADNTIINLFAPFASTHTQYRANNINYDGSSAGVLTAWGTMTVTTSYTGFTYIASGSASGSIQVYGYKV